MGKVVFLDRDGVINSDEGLYYIFRISDFRLNPGVPEAIKLMHDKGYQVVVISNQGGIGKGLYTKADTDAVHDYLQQLLAKAGTFVDAFYYCPHHPDSGLCLCRKPGSLMIEKALARFDFDRELSVLIGDSSRDIQAAEAAGVRGYKIPKNSNLLEFIQSIGL